MPRKRFGQHFLIDTFILEKIIACASPKPGEHWVEIGPGEGALTAYLLESGVKLDAIEIDRDLVKQLREKFNALSIHEADVLAFDFKSLNTSKKSLHIIGNLPYNISTPLLFKLFNESDHVLDFYFMLQKEIVDRITAKAGSHNYGRLSVMSQYYCEATALFTVSPVSFSPPPKVYSAFIRLKPHHPPKTIAKDIGFLSALVKEAFTYRRKTLANALKRMISQKQLLACDINPQSRAQELTVEDFVKISNYLS